ncbi:cytochrome P450 1A1 isoform X2 [Folsomia candida]|uniref:cytochrome P450 1A1 isoform X2 n=1 Tax=Folsomia candida TaxID=158441 RepID=UPI001604EBBF|nr:cytochrome P450 1A1 isoform X2 [Folsomia candida]
MLILVLRLAVAVVQEIFRWEWLYYAGIIAGVLFLISLCDELNDRFKRIPFGPMRLPIIGNRVQLALYGGNRPYVAITRMGRWYRSGFMKVFNGLSGYVSVNGAQRLSEVLHNDDEWAGERDEVWRLDRTETEKRSTSSLAVWVSRRNTATRCLESILLSRKEALNGLISKQVNDLLVGIESQERVDKLGMREIGADTFLPYVISSVWSVLTGDVGIEVTDRRVQTIHRCLKDWEEKGVKLSAWSDHYPFMVRWFPGWAGWNKLQEVNHDFRKVLKSLIKEQYKKAEKGKLNNELSYVQACIREFKELRKQSFGSEQMNDSSSIALLFEFLCPGPLMTSSAVGFCLSYAARDSAAQEKIAAEIRTVTRGVEGDVPKWEEMENMPFTAAFILESYRISSVVPLERRKLLKLVRSGEGIRFPREMPLLLNYHSANMDPKVWDEPAVFKPERFLDASGKRVVGQDRLISLEAEKHLCAGEPLLRMILFSFLTGLLYRVSQLTNSGT